MNAYFSIICVVFASLLPVVVFASVVVIEWHRAKRTEKPPQQEKLLRPAGYSLSVQLESLQNEVLMQVLYASMLCSLSGACALILGVRVGNNKSMLWSTGALVGFLVLATSGASLVLRARRKLRHARDVRLGLLGEQAVAEALHEAADAGYRIFHDLQTEQCGNIDHVAVGTRGVFVIETKARRRRDSRNGKPDHVVAYDGKRLEFPCGYDVDSVVQVERTAAWLRDFLAKRTAEPVVVNAVIAIPGWYVETKGNYPVKVMNAVYLTKYLRSQSANMETAQLQRIVAALDDKCRDLEF